MSHEKCSVDSCICFSLKRGQAQLWKEWFRQKKTQIEYLVNQIGALQVYIELGQKGYKIVDEGLTAINNIKTGDFNLHNDFFNALKSINPKIRNSANVADIIALQIKIIESEQRIVKSVRESDLLTQQEVDYVIRVGTRLLIQTADNVELLMDLITANRLVLSDDERINRINLIHADVQDQYEFIQQFSNETGLLILSRGREIQDSKILRTLISEKQVVYEKENCDCFTCLLLV